MSPTTLDDLKREFGRGSTQERKNPSKLSDMIMNDMRKVHGIYSGEGGSIFNNHVCNSICNSIPCKVT